MESAVSWGAARGLGWQLSAAPAKDRGPSLTPSASYFFQDHLNAEQEDVPPLMPLDPLGRNSFETAVVYGEERLVYRMDGNPSPARDNAGLVLDTTGLMSPNSYSVEMVFAFTERPGPWRKVLDVQNRQSDNGLYVNPSDRLEVWPVQAGSRTIQLNVYYHFVLTNVAGAVDVYLDGVRDFRIPNTAVMNINNPENLLHILVDDSSGGEYADSRIALFRAYDGGLTAADVAVLAANPFLYP